jgi:hypothetical protein
MSVERDDIGAGSNDSTLFAMPQLAERYAQARDDYATFAALAGRLQVAEAFTLHRGPDRGPVAAPPVRAMALRPEGGPGDAAVRAVLGERIAADPVLVR